MTQKLKTIIFATALTALAACSDDVTHGDKFTVGDADNAINLSIGVQSSPTALQSRAPLAGHYAMQENTAINLYVEGDWTRMGGTIKKKSIYSAQADTDADNINAITRSSGDYLYWDDFGTADPDNTANRTKGLGILAVAIDGLSTAPTVSSDDYWKGTSNLPWEVSTDGTNALHKDILVANNLYHATEYTPQKRYTFAEQKGSDPAESRLDFKHVLSKITFILTPGEGFKDLLGNPGFNNVKIDLMRKSDVNWCYTKGTINIPQSTATNDGSTLGKVTLDDIVQPGGETYHEAVIFPGSQFGNETDVIAQINADFNIYYVTAAQIREAINTKFGSDTSHEHYEKYETLGGYNYVFKVKLNKTGINVTATISDWKEVEAAEVEPSNAYISLNLLNQGSVCKDFDIYRRAYWYSTPITGEPSEKNYDWLSTYYGPATLTEVGADGNAVSESNPFHHFKTDWYFESNMDFYHFRTVKKGTTVTTHANGDYFEINSTDVESYDPHWGAPMLSTADLKYSPTEGYKSSIHYAIGATKDCINITEMHMMSQIKVILETTGTDAADAVKLTDASNVATVKLVKYCKDGKVELGRGLVTPSNVTDATAFAAPALASYYSEQSTTKQVSKEYIFNVVPQILDRTDATGSIGIEIETTDHDVYKLEKISTIKANSVGSSKDQTVNDYITRWYPGHKYTYTFRLKKTGITDVIAKITDWTTVTGSDDIWF
ncbi:MAG: fimbrillin family protein [Bacteroidales bacterium]|nr:fimbrillin family protein [Bacteroidales bacterium]